jgi:hypothetical protein
MRRGFYSKVHLNTTFPTEPYLPVTLNLIHCTCVRKDALGTIMRERHDVDAFVIIGRESNAGERLRQHMPIACTNATLNMGNHHSPLQFHIRFPSLNHFLSHGLGLLYQYVRQCRYLIQFLSQSLSSPIRFRFLFYKWEVLLRALLGEIKSPPGPPS